MSSKLKPTKPSDLWDFYGTKLFINILDCTGLTPTDRAGTSADPSAKIVIGKLEKSTSVIKKSLNPEFNSILTFFDPDMVDPRVEIVDAKKKVFLGQASFRLTDIDEDVVVDKVLQLEPRPGKKKDKVSGKVHLRIFITKKTETRPTKLDYNPVVEHFPHFKPGDLVVISGHGPLDTAIMLNTGFNFSRVAMIIEQPNRWTRVPELYLLECTRNVDNFSDFTEPSPPRRNALCIFRLHERLYHMFASTLWWAPLKVPLTDHQKFKMNEFVLRMHQNPERIPSEVQISDPGLPPFMQYMLNSKGPLDPLELIDLYSSGMCIELLRTAGVCTPVSSEYLWPADVALMEYFSSPILLRSPVGTSRIPSTARAGSDTLETMRETFIPQQFTISPSTGRVGNTTTGNNTPPPASSNSFSIPSSSNSTGSLSTAIPVMPSTAGFSFACAPTRSVGIAGTDRQMVLPDFRTCSMMKLDKLGSGGFGAVWRVSLEGYTCACKVVKISSETDEYDIEALKLETAILERAQHPNIVRYLGHDFRADEMHLFLELMPYSLRDVIKNMKPQDNDPFTVRKIAHEISKGLYYLHASEPPIIHRDIKAENILLTKDGEGRIDQVKICDFGVSKLTEGSGGGAEAQTYVGTLAFMAPEIRKGQGRKAYTAQVDVYSFGVMLYELLVLKPASKGIEKEILQQLRKQREWEHLVDLCLICMNENPTARPTSEVMCKGLAVMFSI